MQRLTYRSAALGLAAVLIVALGPKTATASDPLDEQARRQLDFAWSELDEQLYDRALSSAERALTASPLLFEARLVMALAHAGNKDWARAQFALEEYVRSLSGLRARPEAADLARTLEKKKRWDGPIPAVLEEPSAEPGSEPVAPVTADPAEASPIATPPAPIGADGARTTARHPGEPSIGVGVAALAAGGGLGVVALIGLSEQERLRADYYDGGTTRDEFPGLVDGMQRAEGIAIGAAITAGVLASAGGVLVAVGARQARSRPAVVLIPMHGPAIAGVSVAGAW